MYTYLHFTRIYIDTYLQFTRIHILYVFTFYTHLHFTRIYTLSSVIVTAAAITPTDRVSGHTVLRSSQLHWSASDQQEASDHVGTVSEREARPMSLPRRVHVSQTLRAGTLTYFLVEYTCLRRYGRVRLLTSS